MNESHENTPARPATSRRELLALTAAAAAGVNLLSSACATSSAAGLKVAKGQTRPAPGPDQPLKIGIVGIGPDTTPAMGYGHLASICSLAKAGKEKVQIVAVCDVAKPCMERGVERARKEQGIAVEGYSDYVKMLERDDLNGVLVATPEHWHSKMSIDALMAGLDVYCEKPMTLNLDQALALRAVAKANTDKMFQCGTQFLQHRKYHKAKELIKAGAIGAPTFTQTSYCRNNKSGEWLYGVKPEITPGANLDWAAWCGPMGKAEWDPKVFHQWRRYRKWSTGIVGDLLVHVTSPLVWALDMGWPTRVVAIGGHYHDKAMENHDQVNLTVEFEKGHTLTIAGSTCNETGVEILVRGHKANLYLGGNDCILRPEREFAEEIDEQSFPSGDLGMGDQDLHRLDWFASMRSRKAPIGDVDTATKVMVIVDLATRSMWDRSSWSFDPATLSARRA